MRTKDTRKFKRGEVYMNEYTNKRGETRKCPVLILSPDGINDKDDYVTVVKLTRTYSHGFVVTVPESAFSDAITPIHDSYVLPGTICSVRKNELDKYPVAKMKNPYYMGKITDAVMQQIGVMPMDYEQITPRAEKTEKPLRRPTNDEAWYSAALDVARRETGV